MAKFNNSYLDMNDLWHLEGHHQNLFQFLRNGQWKIFNCNSCFLDKERLRHYLLSRKRNLHRSCKWTDCKRFAIKAVSCSSVSWCPSWHAGWVDGRTYCRHCCNDQLRHGRRQAKR